MLATLALASTDDWSTSSATVIVPDTSAKRPLTLLTIRCRTTKPTSEWLGSTFQVPGVRPSIVVMKCSFGVLDGPGSAPSRSVQRRRGQFIFQQLTRK